MAELLLGVNIDHIATLRNARGTDYPDPVQAAFIAEQAGADGITVHLREDRRHITDRDVRILRQTLHTRMNLEMAVTEEMLAIAVETSRISVVWCRKTPKSPPKAVWMWPDSAIKCVMPVRARRRLASVFRSLSMPMKRKSTRRRKSARRLSKSIPAATPTQKPMRNRQRAGAYCQRRDLAARLGLKVNAGHGLTYHNVKAIAALPEMHELNIGHAIIGRAVMTGLKEAVAEMKRLMLEARG